MSDPATLALQKKALVAALVDKHGVEQIWHFARLTDRQIREIVCHPRDKNGGIIWPEEEVKAEEKDEPPTLEEQLAKLDFLAAMLKMRPEKVAEAKEKLRARHVDPVESD